MEELQDAIEDVQYLQAVNSKDAGPTPTEPWPFPSEKALEEFNMEHLKRNKQFYSLETICACILGLYMFGRFCTDRRKELSKYQFMLDVIRYRRLRTAEQRQKFAHRMIRKFILKGNFTGDEDHVLIDKTPLKRKGATPACLVEFKNARSNIQCQDGEGANQLGVTGKVVERLARLVLLRPAPSDSASRTFSKRGDGAGEQDRDRNGDVGGYSQVAFTHVRESGDNRETPDEAYLAMKHNQMMSDTHEAMVNQTLTAHASGSVKCEVSRTVGTAARRGDLSRTGIESIWAQNSDRYPRSTLTASVSKRNYLGEYPIDLFDVLEMWIFDYLRENLHAKFMLSGQFQEYARFLHIQHRPVTENDFILFRVLGRGGFGAVNGCKRGASGKLFAMKVMNKRRIKIRQSEDLCWNERRILEALGSPFVVSLKYAFESKKDLFLILDLMTGGDLGFHLQQLGTFNPDMAKYYTARTILGIRHLHEQGIVYRDLKPENVMLDEHGRSRISDMGLACKVTPHLTGACGTRGYWAPEMRRRGSTGKRVPYNECVDWFSLGCILYEFLRGMSPFRTERALAWCADNIRDKEKCVDKATLEMEPEYPPEYFDDLAADLCTKLLVKDAKRRLGHKGADHILAHPWFASLDLDAICMDQVDSPYVPNKDINAAPQRAIGSFADAGSKVSLSREDQAYYKDWAYTCVDDFQTEVVESLKYRDDHDVGFVSRRGMECCGIS